jgi:serine/threonine protein kinase
MIPQPGNTFAGYRIARQIGFGAMGMVFQAHDSILDRTVALKVLPILALDQEAVERFRRETRALAQLRHPHILTVFTGGVEEGIPYLVTEFAAGGTLAEKSAGTPLSHAEALRLLQPIAEALDYIHGKGIVHRDVKPQNILLDAEGQPLLADFGVARLRGGQGTLTATGELLGTPAYMAPEYVQGTPVGPATDRYALAVVAYELLVGRLPYDGSTGIQLLLAHARDPLPSPYTENPAISLRLEAALLRGLARDPLQRYPTAVALIAALTMAAAAPATPVVQWPVPPGSQSIAQAQPSYQTQYEFGQALVGAPASQAFGPDVLPPLVPRFWLWWTSGTFVPPIGGGLIFAANADAAWILGLGILCLAVNILFALASHGYEDGQAARSGRVIAYITGAFGAAVVAVVAFAVMVLLMSAGDSKA